MKKSLLIPLLLSTSAVAVENDNLKSKHGVGAVVSTDSLFGSTQTSVEYNGFNNFGRVGLYGRLGLHDHGSSAAGGVNIRLGSMPLHIYTGLATTRWDHPDYVYNLDGVWYSELQSLGVDVGLKYSGDHFYTGLGINGSSLGANFSLGFTF